MVEDVFHVHHCHCSSLPCAGGAVDLGKGGGLRQLHAHSRVIISDSCINKTFTKESK